MALKSFRDADPFFLHKVGDGSSGIAKAQEGLANVSRTNANMTKDIKGAEPQGKTVGGGIMSGLSSAGAGAMIGAQIGTVGGPAGAAIGAVLGIAAYMLS